MAPALNLSRPRSTSAEAAAPHHAPCMTTRLRVLYVTVHRLGGELVDIVARAEEAGVLFEEVQGVAAGMARLRDEVFDAVLVAHEPEDLDALAFTQAMRAGGAEEAVIVLGWVSEAQMAVACYEAGADAYVCEPAATANHLVWVLARAAERQQLIRQVRRLSQAEESRLAAEHSEARRLLGELAELTLGEDGEIFNAQDERPLPDELISHYQQLLRAYVIMGSGHLRREVSQLAELLATAGISGRQLLQLHLYVLEDTLAGLGNRSSRHVFNRADLLGLEVITRLADCYRRRYRERQTPPRQQLLPGFDAPDSPMVVEHGTN